MAKVLYTLLLFCVAFMILMLCVCFFPLSLQDWRLTFYEKIRLLNFLPPVVVSSISVSLHVFLGLYLLPSPTGRDIYGDGKRDSVMTITKHAEMPDANNNSVEEALDSYQTV